MMSESAQRRKQHNDSRRGPTHFPKIILVLRRADDVAEIHAVVAGEE